MSVTMWATMPLPGWYWLSWKIFWASESLTTASARLVLVKTVIFSTPPELTYCSNLVKLTSLVSELSSI